MKKDSTKNKTRSYYCYTHDAVNSKCSACISFATYSFFDTSMITDDATGLRKIVNALDGAYYLNLLKHDSAAATEKVKLHEKAKEIQARISSLNIDIQNSLHQIGSEIKAFNKYMKNYRKSHPEEKKIIQHSKFRIPSE